MSHRIFGLIGNPLGHSFSARFFNDFFKDNGIDAEYRNFELHDIGELMEVIAEYPEIAGLNVTIPYKEQVIPYLASLDSLASRIGAVNTIQFSKRPLDGDDFTMKGYNTDVLGFMGSVRPFLSEEVRARKDALVLGSGGVSKAICEGLRLLGFVPHTVSRTPADGQIGYRDVDAKTMSRVGVIANATPMGMWPHVEECPAIPYDALLPGTVCFDAVYNPERTLFLKRCAQYGGVMVGGLEMLHIQAREAWKIWGQTTG